MNDKLNLIREKCIAANPEIGELKKFVCENCGGNDEVHYRPIHLADVLLAIAERIGFATVKELGINSFGEFFFSDNIKERWNLRTDLENQSEETINFLYELLK